MKVQVPTTAGLRKIYDLMRLIIPLEIKLRRFFWEITKKIMSILLCLAYIAKADMYFLHCRTLFRSMCLIKTKPSTPAVFHYKQKQIIIFYYCYYCCYYHRHLPGNNMQIKRWKYQPNLQISTALLSWFSYNPVVFIRANPQEAR